jgi:hypothetical protein
MLLRRFPSNRLGSRVRAALVDFGTTFDPDQNPDGRWLAASRLRSSASQTLLNTPRQTASRST